ncbi:MAG: 2-C-methyl-D-erythritol 4-phosphate cytidylyltransferase [Nocardioidaceae bacterium]|nr:2-C-methyl-D-erythritol 4-phosphate cytidylyltransferase [Nocardioidaceae bacterium]MCL2613869.1 2-C-methyl-D-erythritol 4-phosphate cytidylyltransferase [Nocardioidaceae bacterium]
MYDEQRPAASGIILDADRGTLPFQLIHGESLVAAAAWSAGEAGVELVDSTLPLAFVVEREEPLVLHDPLCPMTPPDFLAACVDRCVGSGEVVVGVRPVTDTVKRLHAGDLGETVDRDGLVAVCSPVVLPPDVLAGLATDAGLPTTDLVRLLALVRHDHAGRVALMEAPPAARRVADADDVRLLEALTLPDPG